MVALIAANLRRSSALRYGFSSLLDWCFVRLGTGFPKTATSTSMCASLRPSMAYEIFGKPVPNPTGRTFCWSLVSFAFRLLSVWVRERPWLINFIFPCFSVSSVAKKSPPPHIMHPSLNPQHPQLLIMPPSEVQHRRIVMGHQRQAAVLISVVR